MFEVKSEVAPVFVDVSGRRRRRLRWVAYAIGITVLVALLAMWLSQLGGTVRPQPVTPCQPAASAPQSAGGCARR
jgi:hypothetical protein